LPDENRKLIGQVTKRIGDKELGIKFHWENGFDENVWDVLIKAKWANRVDGCFVSLPQSTFTPPWKIPGTNYIRLSLSDYPDLTETYCDYWVGIFEKLADYWHQLKH
jgi:hypothetical protein